MASAAQFVPARPGPSRPGGGTKRGGAQAQAIAPELPAQPAGTGVDVWRILRRHKWLIIGSVAVAVALVTLYLSRATPLYTATATMQVAAYGQEAAEIGDAVPLRPQDELRITTQIQLLKSPALGRQVAKRLDLYDDPEFLPQPVRPPLSWAKTVLRAIQPHPAAGIEPRDKTAQRRAVTVDNLLSQISVKRLAQSSIIEVAVRTADARKSVAIANILVDTHVDSLRDDKRGSTVRAIAALETRVAELREQAISGERAAASYGRSRGLVANTSQTPELNPIDRLGGALGDARAARAESEARYRQFSSGDDASSGASATTPLLTDLRGQLAGLDKRLAELSAQFGAGHPDVISARAQRNDVAARMSVEVGRVQRDLGNDLAIKRAREGQLNSDIGATRSRAFQTREANVGLSDLQRSAETTRALYLSQLARLQDLRGREVDLPADAQFLSKAVLPTTPSDPQPMRLLGVAVTGGLMFGLLLAFAGEMLDDRLRTSDQVAQLLGVATLAMVPELPGAPSRETSIQSVFVNEPSSVFAESLRGLLLALDTRMRRPQRCIVVTSPLPREGKTTIALGLASASAALGRRTVVVDLDLRRPALLEVMHHPVAELDAVAYLEGRAKLFEVVGTDAILPRLHVIGVAHEPADPGGLVASAAMRELIAELRTNYDVVVINAPPVLPVHDALVLAGLADATLMVLRWGKSRPDAARVAADRLGPLMTAVVLNRVDYRRHARRAYGDQLHHYGDYESYFGVGAQTSSRS